VKDDAVHDQSAGPFMVHLTSSDSLDMPDCLSGSLPCYLPTGLPVHSRVECLPSSRFWQI
jgi:hypothetical protein